MIDQLQETLDMFGEEVDSNVVIPAYTMIMGVGEDSTQLNEKRSESFHSVVARLLFIMKRARPDLELTISFLMQMIGRS